MTLRSVMLSIQALLNAAEPDDPQDAVVAQQYKNDPEGFSKTAKYWTSAYAGGTTQLSADDQSSLDQLVAMGFETEVARNALSNKVGNETRNDRTKEGKERKKKRKEGRKRRLTETLKDKRAAVGRSTARAAALRQQDARTRAQNFLLLLLFFFFLLPFLPFLLFLLRLRLPHLFFLFFFSCFSSSSWFFSSPPPPLSVS